MKARWKSALAGSCVGLALVWTSGAMATAAPLNNATGTYSQSGVQEPVASDSILAQAQFVCYARSRATKELFEGVGATLELAQERALRRCTNRATECFIASCR